MKRPRNDYWMSNDETLLHAILHAGYAAEKDARIDDTTFRVMVEIIDHLATAPRFPDRKTLCSLTGYSPLVVSRALVDLAACGYLVANSRVKVAGQRSALSYSFRIPTDDEVKAEVAALTAYIRSLPVSEGCTNG